MTDAELRLAELETRVAFQDDALETLNRAVIELRAEAAALREQLRGLQERLRAVEPGAVGAREDEPPPPHY